MGGAAWYGLNNSPMPNNMPNQNVESTIEWYIVKFGDVVVGADIPNGKGIYDWTVLDTYLSGAASRGNHVTFATVIGWRYPYWLSLPNDLMGGAIELVTLDNGEVHPNYGDPLLMSIVLDYVEQLGQRYDGDQRIIAVQLALLGFWYVSLHARRFLFFVLGHATLTRDWQG